MPQTLRPLIITLTLSILAVLILGFSLLWTADLFFNPPPSLSPDYGVTFSLWETERLGLSPTAVYQSLLDDLQVKRMRLPVYWNTVESRPGRFNFQTYDNLLDLARTRQVKVILTVGYKAPRWPECFAPDWTAEHSSPAKFQEQILLFIGASIDHFKNRPEIIAWQVENEPLFPFGSCQTISEDFLQKEVALVRSKDSRPVILTDSGEMGSWLPAARQADIFGTSLYRTIWTPTFGYIRYPIPPLYYRLKTKLVQQLLAPSFRLFFVSELQSEPWQPGIDAPQTPIPQQTAVFSAADFKSEIAYAARTGIKEQYLWGVEWWYFMKSHGHPEYWEYAKSLF